MDLMLGYDDGVSIWETISWSLAIARSHCEAKKQFTLVDADNVNGDNCEEDDNDDVINDGDLCMQGSPLLAHH